MDYHTFSNLPEAQAFARANNIPKYWRVWFDDADTRAVRGRGGVWPSMTPAYRIYMDLGQALECLQARMGSLRERTTIETLWTDSVSNSKNAR